ncbi:ECF transporter S component [Peptoniphilus sp.]|jgi:energy-coupling factor transport system substrate-specific component|uniref:ECF transporter S component n=1 Tax=Peptoniphilus sp. TaxID=1971214 RepID=UPI003D921435
MKINSRKLTILAMCIAINLVGAWIALIFKLPIYLDSIGTIMAGFSFGPGFGIITGVITSFVNMLGDPIAIYFLPTQLIVGYIAGAVTVLKEKNSYKKIYQAFIMSIPAAISSALIATYVFGTVTTAGSSYIVQFLRATLNMSDFLIVFIVQIVTDYADKFIGIFLVAKIYNMEAFQKILERDRYRLKK